MTISIKENILRHSKGKKVALTFVIVFACLAVISITLFIVFSNYKIQLMMSIIGSVVSSIFAVTSIGFLLISYLPHKYLFNFFKQLEVQQGQTIRGLLKKSDRHLTLKKGLSFLTIYIDDKEYYLSDEKLSQGLLDDEQYDFLLKGDYVIGASLYE